MTVGAFISKVISAITPGGSAPAPVKTTDAQRLQMAKIIINYEARRDRNGHLMVYALPPGDGGGTYEVAGINDGFHPKDAARLAALIRAGRYDEAERGAEDFIIDFTNACRDWSTSPAIEFYLRDCVHNRGPKGSARILQRALGVADDGDVGPDTRAALARAEKDPKALLAAMRRAREQYERDVAHRNESSPFWRGLVNRWNNAQHAAETFLPEAATQKAATQR